MYKTLVVVAENSRARIFSMEHSGAPLQELADMQHSESRAHERDLVSDRPGRTFDSRGMGRHAKEPDTPTKKHEASNFAKSIADYVNSEADKGTFEELMLIAAPEFLGLLRKDLHDTVKQHITREIDKNIVKKDIAFIQNQVTTLPEQ